MTTYGYYSFTHNDTWVDDTTELSAARLNVIETGVENSMSNLNKIVPVGTIAPYAGTTIPSGWLKCNGQAVDRTVYSDLYAVIATFYGSGNGSTTFNVPDLRGLFVRVFDDSAGRDPAGNRALNNYQADDVKSHNHTGTDNYGTTNGWWWSGTSGGANAPGTDTAQTCVAAGSTEGVPNNIAMYYIIKV